MKKNGVGFSGRWNISSLWRRRRPAANFLELEPLAERIAALPVALRHGLVDHGDERDFFVIGAGEFAAGDERNAQVTK